jgi:hypothetical protein
VAADDPFTQVYDKLCELVFARSDVAALVKPGNRLSYTSDARQPMKSGISTEDLPEMVLRPVSVLPHVPQSSNTSAWVATYQWMIATGDLRLDEAYYPLQFALLRAMTAVIMGTGMAALTWNSKPYVIRVRIAGITEGMVDPEQIKMIRGWVALWNIEVMMNFTTADLAAEA